MTSDLRQQPDRGLLIVLSGPSGVGKGTVCKALREVDYNLVYSVSATTRAPRAGEIDGVNYFFKTKEQFIEMIEQNQLLEWAEYVGNYYGTPRSFVEETLAAGQDVILEIEVQGALKVRQKFAEAVFIFLMPPSLVELQNRIQTRGTDSAESIVRRMSTAIEELRMIEQYDYCVVNDQVEAACARIQAILVAEHCRRERVLPKIHNWMEEVH
ncbi:MAG: guanylate kinase [Paenibacillaceae bacterium]|jgi:guanylate kinase|nr:guanylate kinase [Paenibacillaceae bacterium]